MQLKDGSLLQNGKYRIIRVLGQGGFGITYLAENTFFDKLVAIKEFFPKDFCGRDNTSHLTLGTQNNAETVEKLKARFLKEAKNIAKLEYPGIVKIHDVFEDNNTAYYVMDYIEGVSLSDMVKNSGLLPENKAIEYITKIGDALEYIHSRQMTHFDVKPANVMVRKSDDTPILIDFGLSKQYDVNGDATSTIMQGVSHGFSPIELYSSNSVATFSPQTDVYSLGATLYYLLTGTAPPSASQVLEDGLQFPTGISSNICSAIKRAMSANRAKRYKSVKNFCRTLSKGVSTESDESTEQVVSHTEEAPTEETKLVEGKVETQSAADLPQTAETSDVEEQEYAYEEEPSGWDKFVNWICGTENLVNANQIPNSKKGAYLLLLSILIIAAAMFPIGGWLFLIAIHKYIRNSLQRLFFADYLDEWDDAYDYSKGKAITILTLVMCIPIALGVLVFSISRADKKKEVTEYVTNFSASCPIVMFDSQIMSASLVDGEIIYTCQSFDSIHTNRDYLNNLNVELWKMALSSSTLDHSKIAKNHNLTFKFYNNGTPMKSVTITAKDFENYSNLSMSEKSRKHLDAYLELENTYLPYDLGGDVKLTDVSITPYVGEDGNYLSYNFYDPTHLLNKEFGDSLNIKIYQFLPTNLPFLSESIANCTNGMGFKISDSNGIVEENILHTSAEIKQLIEDYYRNQPH